MTDRPIIPTRVIPAGAPLPDRGPLPGERPPWHLPPAPAAAQPPAPPAPAPAAPAPAPEPHPVQVYVTLQPAPYYNDEPTRRERLWAWLRTIGRPWQVGGALILAFLPIPGLDYSVATTWASCVTYARDEWGQQAGYAYALVPLAIAVMRITRSGGTLKRLLLLAISLTGLAGAIDLYDPVTWITGVRP